MSKKFFKAVGIGALCLAGTVGLTACGDKKEEKKIVSIDVIESTIPDSFKLGSLDSQNIFMKVKYSDGTDDTVQVKSDMIPKEYQNYLNLPGQHNIVVNYDGFKDVLKINVTLNEELVNTYMENAYNYAITHDHEVLCNRIYKNYKNNIEETDSRQVIDENYLYNYHSDTKAEAIGYMHEMGYFYESTPYMYIVCGDSYFDYCNIPNEEIATILNTGTFLNEYLICPSDDFYPLSEAKRENKIPTFEAKLVNNEIVYTAQFAFTEINSSCTYNFTQEKLISITTYSSHAYGEDKHQTIDESTIFNYREIDDSETDQSLIDTSILTNGINSLETNLSNLKNQKFNLTKVDLNYDEGHNYPTEISDTTVNYTHEIGSDDLVNTKDSSTITLASLIPNFDEYYKAWGNSDATSVSVTNIDLQEISCTITSDGLSIEIYDYKTNEGYKLDVTITE